MGDRYNEPHGSTWGARPAYLPKWGLRPFKEAERAFNELPDSPIKARMAAAMKQMMVSAMKFYKQGERFKPQVEHIVKEARNLQRLMRRLPEADSKADLKFQVDFIVKAHWPIWDDRPNW
jgi:hypothetical protein